MERVGSGGSMRRWIYEGDINMGVEQMSISPYFSSLAAI